MRWLRCVVLWVADHDSRMVRYGALLLLASVPFWLLWGALGGVWAAVPAQVLSGCGSVLLAAYVATH